MAHLWTIGFQVVNFVLLLFLLHRYLWKPVRAAIDKRKKEIDDAGAGIAAREKAAEDSRAAYEAGVLTADHERARVLAATAVALAESRDKVLAGARAEAAAELSAARAKLDEERSAAAGELTQATLDLAATIARKLLGEVRGAAITGAFLDRLCESLDALPPTELAALRAEVGAGGAVQVATAPALDGAAREALQARLGPPLGAAVKLDFVVDDALIAGAELRFAHARLGHSFQHGLAAARKQLTAPGHPELRTHEEIVDT